VSEGPADPSSGAGPVRVALRRSGGLAGVTMAADVDADQLGSSHAALVDDLLSAEPAPAEQNTGRGGPDRFSYELTVQGADRSRTYRWGESEVPERVRPLIDELSARAEPTRSA
jgi:hypothetical protein